MSLILENSGSNLTSWRAVLRWNHRWSLTPCWVSIRRWNVVDQWTRVIVSLFVQRSLIRRLIINISSNSNKVPICSKPVAQVVPQFRQPSSAHNRISLLVSSSVYWLLYEFICRWEGGTGTASFESSKPVTVSRRVKNLGYIWAGRVRVRWYLVTVFWPVRVVRKTQTGFS